MGCCCGTDESLYADEIDPFMAVDVTYDYNNDIKDPEPMTIDIRHDVTNMNKEIFPSSEKNKYIPVPNVMPEKILGDIDRRRIINQLHDNTQWFKEVCDSFAPDQDGFHHYDKETVKMKDLSFLMRMRFNNKYYIGSCVCYYNGDHVAGFMTCAHNLVCGNNTYNIKYADAAWVYIRGTLHQIKSYHIYPKYFDDMSPDSGNDFAMFTLEKGVYVSNWRYSDQNKNVPKCNLTCRFHDLGKEDLEGGIYGYPGSKKGVLWGMEGIITRNMYWHGKKLSGYGYLNDGKEILTYDIDTEPGNSGSPIFVTVPVHLYQSQNFKEKALIGIHTGAYCNKNRNMGTFITDEKDDWARAKWKMSNDKFVDT